MSEYKVRKTALITACFACFVINTFISIPVVSMMFSMAASGFFIWFLYAYFDELFVNSNTDKKVVSGFNGERWIAYVRNDKKLDKYTEHIYRVYFVKSAIVDDVSIDDNVMSFPNGFGSMVKERNDSVQVKDIGYDWIGWNGEDGESRSWKNAFSNFIKLTHHNQAINVIACSFVRQSEK